MSKRLNKNNKVPFSGYLLSKKEYNEYKHNYELISLLKEGFGRKKF